MNIHNNGERIAFTYQVEASFPFVKGILYYTSLSVAEGEEAVSTRFVHALPASEVKVEEGEDATRQKEALIPLEQVFREEGVFYQVLEPFTGTLLLKRMAAGNTSLAEATYIAFQLSKHLLRLSEENQFTVVHPQNIFLFPEGEIRFLYGGTIGCMPSGYDGLLPERLLTEAEQRAGSVDMKALATLYYRMITKKQPTSDEDLILQLRMACSEIPWDLGEWVERCLDPKRVEDRPGLKESAALLEHMFINEVGQGWVPQWDVLSSEEDHPECNDEGEQVSVEEPTMQSESSDRSEGEQTRKESVSERLPLLLPKMNKDKSRRLLVWGLTLPVVVVVMIGIFMMLSPPDADGPQEIELNPTAAKQAYESAVEAYKKGKVEQAIQFGESAFKHDPSQEKIALYLANLYGEERRYHDGVEVLSRVKSDFSLESAKVDYLLAHLMYYENRLEEGKKSVEQAIKLDEKKPEYYHLLSKISYSMDDPKQAITAIEQAIKLHDSRPLYYYESAVYHLATKDMKVARQHIDKALELDSYNKKYWLTKGNIDLKDLELVKEDKELSEQAKKDQSKKLAKKALASFKEAVKLDSLDPSPRFHLSVAYAHLGDLKKAEAEAKNAMLRGAEVSIYSYQYAVILEKRKKKKDAATFYELSDSLSKDYDEPQVDLSPSSTWAKHTAR
ncbi:tetratricopeptide repeat protein [Mechercharimyces sp. CAU 1602]|uniref:tetratricopeptide repeat protein n=1 Tax=Mechercharimyces sp. CAU 1602 TaxID=2973933 RepID=UPI002163C661|nr:tetratricopeptide repeat protein [Mechercharimyces sp. CAU 1602]MCS1352460.1 tetratricopeptide repeat protein [Mechercharimyces sp. CAU 1602]